MTTVPVCIATTLRASRRRNTSTPPSSSEGALSFPQGPRGKDPVGLRPPRDLWLGSGAHGAWRHIGGLHDLLYARSPVPRYPRSAGPNPNTFGGMTPAQGHLPRSPSRYQECGTACSLPSKDRTYAHGMPHHTGPNPVRDGISADHAEAARARRFLGPRGHSATSGPLGRGCLLSARRVGGRPRIDSAADPHASICGLIGAHAHRHP
jgi:hypothetical protein